MTALLDEVLSKKLNDSTSHVFLSDALLEDLAGQGWEPDEIRVDESPEGDLFRITDTIVNDPKRGMINLRIGMLKQIYGDKIEILPVEAIQMENNVSLPDAGMMFATMTILFRFKK